MDYSHNNTVTNTRLNHWRATLLLLKKYFVTSVIKKGLVQTFLCSHEFSFFVRSLFNIKTIKSIKRNTLSFLLKKNNPPKLLKNTTSQV